MVELRVTSLSDRGLSKRSIQKKKGPTGNEISHSKLNFVDSLLKYIEEVDALRNSVINMSLRRRSRRLDLKAKYIYKYVHYIQIIFFDAARLSRRY